MGNFLKKALGLILIYLMLAALLALLGWCGYPKASLSELLYAGSIGAASVFGAIGVVLLAMWLIFS